MNKTKIPWCNYTWNPITGCTPISEGCQNCYAAALTKRFEKSWGDFNTIRFYPGRLNGPGKVKKPSRIFVCSMGDLFHGFAKLEWQLEVFKVIEANPHHTFQILTKRPDQITMLQHVSGYKFPNNAWIGVTVENQKQADIRIPELLKIKAAVRFVSCEPLLEKIDLSEYLYCPDCKYTEGDARFHCDHHICGGPGWVNWVIAGSETGPKARLCKPDWINSLHDQCQCACGIPAVTPIPFFYKQGEAAESVKACREFPNGQPVLE